ncbi:MAG: hypothetical protein OJF51_003477 [Nitrospira sp.]|nr:MAG: hypothetical protein OJF51_003477 [Nitrospira sp.]
MTERHVLIVEAWSVAANFLRGIELTELALAARLATLR